jgi:dipeptidyl aminopeptidase/acylaminoacyl peptidase
VTSFFRPARPRGDVGRSGPRPPGRGPRTPLELAWLPAYLAPFLAVLGLILVAVVSVNLMNGQLPSLPGGPGASNAAVRTATPSNVVVTDPRADVPGSILYVKDGNIWVQSGVKATQLTNGGSDYQPTWSPDGKLIYFVRDKPADGRFIINGLVKDFDLEIPSLERMNPDGSNVHAILAGRYPVGSFLWSFFIKEPSIAPDGKTAAIITDGPIPTRSDIVLKFVDLSSGAITDPRLPELGGLGHQDPAFSPDGKYVAFVKNAREGAKGAPTIVRYALATKGLKALTGPGYIQPAWSPDSRYIAATKSSSLGTDIVLIDAKTGAEVLRLTNDQSSFAPVWSPAGDAIVYQHVDRGVVDLWLVKLVGSGPNWQVGTSLALTVAAGVDGTSRESWFIPADQLPQPTATPVPTAGPSGAGSPPSPQPS